MTVRRSKERVTKPCDHCGKPVTRLRSAGSGRVYCDHRCYTSSAAHKDRARALAARTYPDASADVSCGGCGQALRRPRSRIGKQSFCSRECRVRSMAATPVRQITSAGYVRIYVGHGVPGATKTGQILEHRKVMQDRLGRSLLPEENVHHVNGDRSDNRPENLELWSRSQPCGQRVEDKIRWARELLEIYGDVFPG